MEILQWLLAHAGDLVMVLALLVGAASVITGLTPSPKDDAIVSKIRAFVDRLSLLTHSDAPGTMKLPLTKSQKAEE